MFNWLGIGALNLSVAVLLGAFGAHGLKHSVEPEQLIWWSTATNYFFVHALGVLFVGSIVKFTAFKPSFVAGLLQTGILLFCGSLYAMALGAPHSFGIITPFGGLCFVLAWLTLAVRAFTFKG